MQSAAYSLQYTRRVRFRPALGKKDAQRQNARLRQARIVCRRVKKFKRTELFEIIKTELNVDDTLSGVNLKAAAARKI